MKKAINILLILVLLAAMSTVFADVEVDEVSKFGKELDFDYDSSFPGNINIEGIYIYEDETDYVVTLKYVDSHLAKEDFNETQKVKTSFFNPPSGDLIKYSWVGNFERVTEGKNIVQYHVEKSLLEEVKMITILLYDEAYDQGDEHFIITFRTDQINFDKLPDEDSLVSGYEIKHEDLSASLNTEPSSWAKNNIEELQLEGILKETVFANFKEGITRKEFVYLMVKVYEEITGTVVQADSSIVFDDSKDLYVAKAATIGITDGIGDNKFGPDIVLNRETMTTFMIKTLNLAGVELLSADQAEAFADEDSISDWAKSFVYTAKINGIMGGVGDNKFSPKTQALNEQVLYITHSLLKSYGSLVWFDEYDGSRLYLDFNDKLYNIELENNILVNEDNQLYLYGLNDIDTLVNALLLKASNLSFSESSNPNFEGILEPYAYNKMNMIVDNIYSGVDKVGEITKIDLGSEDYLPQVIQRFDRNQTAYKDFETVKYYDLENNKQVISTLSLEKIAEVLAFNYEVTYNSAWDIYVIKAVDLEVVNN